MGAGASRGTGGTTSGQLAPGDTSRVHTQRRGSPQRSQQQEDGSSRLSVLSSSNGDDESYLCSEISDTQINAPTTVSFKSLSEVQMRKVRVCLTTLEDFLGVAFSVERILPKVEVASCRQSEVVLTQGEQARGILLVDEGVLEVFSATDDVAFNRLLPGDFCGELSAIFRVPCSASVKSEHRATVLLKIPFNIIQRNVEGEVGKEKMLQWCAKRSYIDMSSMFGPGVLLQRTTVACLKASMFSTVSEPAIEFLAKTAVPMIFSSGQMLYSPEEDSCHVFFILRGEVECSSNTRILSTKNVKYSDEGYCVGLEDFFLGGKRSHSAKALGPLLVVPVNREMILETVRKYPSEATAFRELLPNVEEA